MSIDPLWESQLSWNPHHYCYNNPVNLLDIDGEFPQALIVTAAYVGGVVTIATIGWAYNEITNPGQMKSLSSTVINSFNNAVNDVKNVVVTSSSSMTGGNSNPFVSDATSVQNNVMEMAEHTKGRRPSTYDKHTQKRAGEITGQSRNSNRGDKNKKYQKSKNPNKRKNSSWIVPNIDDNSIMNTNEYDKPDNDQSTDTPLYYQSKQNIK